MRSAQAPVELRQSTGNLLALPILIAVALLAVALRVEGSQSTVVYIVCAGAAVLDIVFVVYLLRNFRARLLVTPDEITFTKGQPSKEKNSVPQQVIHRVGGSTLRFRMARNGPAGSQYTGYVLKLRDNATGHEVYAGAFSRQKVRQACESQGWSFDTDT